MKKNESQFFAPGAFRPRQSPRELKNKSAADWESEGEQMALDLFGYAAKSVPAYRAFLEKEGIDALAIKTIGDFRHLPLTSKNSYLRAFDSADLLPNRDFGSVTTIAATSGSSGEPFYFPRGEAHDGQYRFVAEMFLKNQFNLSRTRKTLGLIGFGLGIWIGGIFTYKNFNQIAAKGGYHLALAPVGPDAALYLETIRRVGKHFDQLILMGYPPFIKDVIDQAADYGITWQDYRLKILTAAEGYSEKFRNYIAEKAGLKNPFADMINIYGTVELGTMAHETALSCLIRRRAAENPKVRAVLFPDETRLPTLAQYYPPLVYFEETGGEVVASGFGSSIPLIRYRFPDAGGVIAYDAMLKRLKHIGIDILQEAEKLRLDRMLTRQPFVYVYGRSDQTVVLAGANIYPEEIRDALHDETVERFLTGKFTMRKKEDDRLNQFLEIHLELKRGVRLPEQAASEVEKPIGSGTVSEIKRNASEAEPSGAGAVSLDLANRIEAVIVAFLRSTNSEYADQYRSNRARVTPRIHLCEYRDAEYFRAGGKQKWAIR